MPVQIETHARLDDAVRACAQSANARFFGGGTLLMRAVNEGDQSFDRIIRCSDPVLREIRMDGNAISIGAGVTMLEVMENRDTAFLAPVARIVGGPAVRSAATIGGNLYADLPYGEMTTALLALGATIRFAGDAQGVSIDDFLRDRASRRNRVVQSIAIPRVGDAANFRFVKVTRVKPKGAALMSIAAYLNRSSGSGGIRVAYGNMGPMPVRALAVERALEGASLDERGIARALEVATEGLEPPTDAFASSWYRREVAPVHLKRLLLGSGRA